LTKDNLEKKNWKGSQQCVCCNFNETIQHLFLDCPSAKIIWRIIFYATNLTQPRSISHMFGMWLNIQHKIYKPLIWVGVAAMCWAIWKKEQAKDTLIAMSRKLEVVALQIANRGWNNFFRLP
jgi:hypothetical protein